MFASSAVATFVALRLLFLVAAPTSLVGAVPMTNSTGMPSQQAGSSSSYWLSTIKRQGTVGFSNSADYKVFRNVKDFGAKGDGTTDDTAAINDAVSSGNRCGQGCDSSTVTPALVYFPPGTYIVSKPIVQLYYTQLVGDAVSLPVIKGAPGFVGMALIDADPYDDKGANWYTNQNNFFRQIRNFVIDLTAMPISTGAGIHWQVAQATSLQNIVFNMVKDANSKQQGIFMDNGSGGFMTDLVFNGGNYGMFLGNQQFTTRNLTFNNCNTAIFMNWNWLWQFKSLSINNCGIGIDMSNGNDNQTVGSVIVQDSKFVATPKGIVTAFSKDANVPATGGTLVIDNCDFTGSTAAVFSNITNSVILPGGSVVTSFAQGNAYTTGNDGSATGTTCDTAAPSATRNTVQGTLAAPSKPASLMNGNIIFERSKPQYETVPTSSFVSVKSAGAKGDGTTDDTAAIQKIFDSAQADQIIYFDHGVYIISSTVKVPTNIKITGEMWPIIMASGAAFSSQTSPAPVFQVGQPGEKGAVEMSDLIFEVKGPQPGAILLEWNLASTSQGSTGIWDVHFRIGGTAGSGLQSDHCAKNPNVTAPYDPSCVGAFLLLHITKTASLYAENTWFWVADHELDLSDHKQINIYNGRGVLVESQGPVWLYGTSSEHNQLYNYNIANARDVYMGIIQTETPYMQSNPNALGGGFTPSTTYSDPDFSTCTTPGCKKAWGLRVFASSDILVYGAGLYSFFENWAQECLKTGSCQEHMVSVECSERIYLWALSTVGVTNMVTLDGGVGVVEQEDNKNNFASTIVLFEEA